MKLKLKLKIRMEQELAQSKEDIKVNLTSCNTRNLFAYMRYKVYCIDMYLTTKSKIQYSSKPIVYRYHVFINSKSYQIQATLCSSLQEFKTQFFIVLLGSHFLEHTTVLHQLSNLDLFIPFCINQSKNF